MQSQILAIEEAVLCGNGTAEEGEIHNVPFGYVALAFEDHGTPALKAKVTKLHDKA